MPHDARTSARDVVEYLEERRKAEEAERRYKARVKNIAIGSLIGLFLLGLLLQELGAF